MITASELAGFFAAHAIWTVSDAEILMPMLAYTTEDGQRRMERLVGSDVQSAVEYGRQKLKTDSMDANDGVLIFDGRITVETGKLDAIILEMRCYGFPDAEATIAVPYTPKTTGRFLVHKPKLLQWHECDDFDSDAVFESFFRGVAKHEEGSRIWNAYLDERK
jgi:hypothetical protein